jgi:hypothetical protein
VPFGVLASRSFQPDPLMILVMLISLHAIFRYHDRPSARRFAAAVTASALAIFVKPPCLFLIFGAFISLALSEHGFRATLKNSKWWIFALGAISPSLVYYPYAILTGGRLHFQAESSFHPQLFLQPTYWLGWLNMVGRVAGYTALIAALLGLLVSRAGVPRSLLAGLWVGYLIFGLVFNYHVHTHDYYNLPLIPVIALSLGPVWDAVAKQLPNPVGTRRMARAGCLLVVVGLTVVVYVRAVWEPLNYADRDQVTIAEQIGRRVNHTTKAFLLSYANGDMLEYHGDLAGVPWPWNMQRGKPRGKAPHSVEERFNKMYQEYSPEYFIVTEMGEYKEQPELREFLATHFALLPGEERYRIFDLRKRPASSR